MLLLVVGPTGAGKDTLLAEARRHFKEDVRVRFVRRVLTRAPLIGGVEDFETVSEREFAARRDAGAFVASWRINGVLYGIPADIALEIAANRVVVCNVSRMVIAELARRFPTRVIEVTAPVNLLARRLAAAGRTDATDAARRLSRTVGLPAGVPSETVTNDGTIEQGAKRLVAAIGRVIESAQHGGTNALPAMPSQPVLLDSGIAGAAI